MHVVNQIIIADTSKVPVLNFLMTIWRATKTSAFLSNLRELGAKNLKIVLLITTFSLRKVKEEDAAKKLEDVKLHDKKPTLETSATTIGNVKNLGIVIDFVMASRGSVSMEYA